jgi:hypothetical protein
MSYPTKLQQLAKHLEVAANQIKRAEEWANCWLVVVAGLGARFVSKSVTSIKRLVAKVFSVVEGRTVNPSEVQRVEVYNQQVHVQLAGQLTYCGLDYFKQLASV